MVDVNISNSCTSQYRYSKGFDSCLYLHGEPLQMTLLVCTVVIFGLFIILFLMLVTAKKLLSNLIKRKHVTIHSLLSKSKLIENRTIRSPEEPYLPSNNASHQSFGSSNASQIYSQQTDKDH
jgi:hypothetical protein